MFSMLARQRLNKVAFATPLHFGVRYYRTDCIY